MMTRWAVLIFVGGPGSAPPRQILMGLHVDAHCSRNVHHSWRARMGPLAVDNLLRSGVELTGCGSLFILWARSKVVR